MGTLFGFVVGYVLGARAGSQSFEDVVQAARELRDSDELKDFIAAVRTHARELAQQLSERFADEGAEGLLQRAQARMRGETGETSPAG